MGWRSSARDDIPMGAKWTQAPGVYKEQYGYDADLRESASVAHIYGQNLVAAESMTSHRGALGMVAGNFETCGGPGIRDGGESGRHPYVGAPAAHQ